MDTQTFLDKAIAELEALSGSIEADDATRDAANAQIKALRLKKQDAAFAAIVARSGLLQECVSGLEAVLEKGRAAGIGDGLKSLIALVQQGRLMLSEVEKELKGEPE